MLAGPIERQESARKSCGRSGRGERTAAEEALVPAVALGMDEVTAVCEGDGCVEALDTDGSSVLALARIVRFKKI
jgi:hypothetical protein